jgi:nitrogen regulatory protein P-II 1
MSNGSITYLTDAVQITAVVQKGRSDDILKACRELGVAGGIVHLARGTGARERLGLLGIAVEAEKEVVTVVAAADLRKLIAEAIYRAGGLDVPGGGYVYISALERLATFIPQDVLARMAHEDEPDANDW